ncbi:MAG TPA: hypothetical protein VNK24_03465 [Elusimicrobiota bacterium]|nr:hypothetical protein [Elusimicrobiota bacterium]
MPHKATQFSVTLRTEPGALPRLAHILGAQQLNIAGLMVDKCAEETIVRFILNPEKDPKAVRHFMADAGYTTFDKQIFVLELPNQPGRFDELARSLTNEGIEIESLYVTADGAGQARLAISVDENRKAQSVLGRLVESEHAAA